MNKEIIPIVVRAGAQAASGVLIAKGIAVDEAQIQGLLGGILMLFTLFWSHRAKEKIKTGNTATIVKP